LFIIIADQVTKALIVANIAPGTIGAEFFDGILRITLKWNKGLIFGIGSDLPDIVRQLVVNCLRLIILILLMIFYFKTSELSTFQRWCICGIVGGGIGNIIDSFFRSEGVVDFIDVAFFGIFGMERWPTFNVADISITICSILFITRSRLYLQNMDKQLLAFFTKKLKIKKKL